MGRKPARGPLPQQAGGAGRRPRRQAGEIGRLNEPFGAVARTVRAELGQGHRYAHSVRVARLAASLARAHGADPRAARLAGMLHDLARLRAAADLLSDCAARGMAVDEFERRHPIVLHARVGAEFARERYGVRDEGTLAAIRAHTLAAPGMPPIAEAVYLADALEPGRDFPEREAFLRVAYEDIGKAMRLVLGSALAYLRGRGLEPAPQTLAALKFYCAPGAEGAALEDKRMEDRLCRT